MKTLVERVAEELRESNPGCARSNAKARSRSCRRRSSCCGRRWSILTRNGAEAAREAGRAARVTISGTIEELGGRKVAAHLRCGQWSRHSRMPICRKSSFPSTPRNPKARAWASQSSKKWHCSTAAASRRATAPAEEPSSCCGYLCGRSPRRRYSPRKPPASKLYPGPIPIGASEGGVCHAQSYLVGGSCRDRGVSPAAAFASSRTTRVPRSSPSASQSAAQTFVTRLRLSRNRSPTQLAGPANKRRTHPSKPRSSRTTIFPLTAAFPRSAPSQPAADNADGHSG